MAIPLASAGWLPLIPDALRGSIGLHAVSADGEVVRLVGDDSLRWLADQRTAVAEPGRVAVGPVGDDPGVVVTYGAGDRGAASSVELLLSLLRLETEKRQLESDLEAMYPSSLALLEEASMWGDVLPTLPAGRTEEEVAQTGLAALVVAAGVERAMFVGYHADLGVAELLVHVAVDADGVSVHPVGLPAQRILARDDGLVWRTLHGDSFGELLTRRDGGAVSGPECWAKRQALAAPVRYGSGSDRTTLGVLLVMDKRTDGYAGSTAELSSQETKLTYAVASMLGSVLGTRRAAAMGKELEAAHTVHRQIQAGAPRAVAGFDLAGHNTACGTVGGDYFDFLPMADGRTLAVIVDVSGHDLASGMVMVSARMSLRLLAARLDDPARVFDDLSRAMHEDLVRSERFMTAAAVALTPGCRRVQVASAGHHDALVLRAAGGAIESVGTDSSVLGFRADTVHDSCELHLDPGDALVLYTDGIVEATDAAGEMFGEERLMAVLRKGGGASAQRLLTEILAAVDTFRGDHERQDDVTVLVIRATPSEDER